jgi:hypothetical protein
MTKGIVLLAAVLLAGCSGSTTASKPSLSASPSSTASPAAPAAHFMTPDASTTKIAANQSGADPFSDFIGFHEVGLRAGQTVTYHVVGDASANYSCNRTDGTLDSAPGSQQVATARADVRQPFVADANGEVIGVIIVPAARPNNLICPPGYATAIWKSSYANMTVIDETNNVTWSAPDSGTQGG